MDSSQTDNFNQPHLRGRMFELTEFHPIKLVDSRIIVLIGLAVIDCELFFVALANFHSRNIITSKDCLFCEVNVCLKIPE